jgi:CubicO group peptidase (beta-lactamase class C family)
MATHSGFERAIDKASSDSDVTGLVARLERPGSDLSWTGARGDLATDTPFFIASTTKLYTTSLVLRLADAGSLALTDRVGDHIEALEGLHVLGDVDRTGEITIRHLLSQTSGLPDYFQGKQPNGKSLEDWLRAGNDRSWDLEYVLDTARSIGAVFPPGTRGKALYSDTNFQLLGRIIELVAGCSYAEAVDQHIVRPLDLHDTWVYSDAGDPRPAVLRDGAHSFPIPKAMVSFGPDGGVVATVSDLMSFLRAFFEGGLFDESRLPGLMEFNRIFYPLQYGVGISRFRLPRVMSPFTRPPDLIGHSGLSGAFAFRDNESGTYLAGTVNNVAKPSRSFQMMLRLLRAG